MSAGAAASVPAGPWCAAARVRAPARHGAPLLPALATVVLLCAPADTAAVTAAGTVTPADAASAVLVVVCGLRLLRHRPRPLGRTAALVLARRSSRSRWPPSPPPTRPRVCPVSSAICRSSSWYRRRCC
ncbi:hypothetical protein [Streptomyces endophytica]|uniref:hypothetical protein n=1 Tax=Streptomyces endophytica TaxID=2991496 RepID=UPI003C6F701E